MANTSPSPVSGLTPEQLRIAENGWLQPPYSALLNVPTGFGKTFLARHAIRNTLAAGYRAVYLCPLRALARELFAQWQQEFPSLGVYTGETGVDEPMDMPAPADAAVLIATPEKFDSYLRTWQSNLSWLASVDLLVVDELHLLADPGRGPVLETLIARLKIINPYVRVLGLSATLGNPAFLADWLGAELFTSNVRPVPLAWRIEPFDAKASGARGKAEIAVREAKRTAQENGQSIVFCQSRPRTEGLAAAMREAGLRAEAHHAGLSSNVRQRIEREYREGALDVVVATPTLAMGINMPCRTAIIHDLQRFTDGGWADLSVTEVWQLAGRAGRPGLDSTGDVVLISPRHNQTAARKFIAGRFEPVTSPLKHPRKLAEQVLVLFGSRLCRTVAQASRLAAGFLYGKEEGARLSAQIAHGVDRMLKAGMLEQADDKTIRATRIGYLAVRHQLSAETVIAWRTFAEHCTEHGHAPTFMDALVLVAGSGDFNNRIRADAEDLPLLTDALNGETMALGNTPIAGWAPAFMPSSGRTVVAAIKTALALRAWTRLGDEEEVAGAMKIEAHEVEEARKEMCRLLVGFEALLLLLRGDQTEPPSDEVEFPERVRALRAMVVTGMNEQNASLALVDGIGPVLARRLLAAGVEDIEDLAQATADDLALLPGISQRRAAKWIEDAESLVGAGGAYRYREGTAGRGMFGNDAGLDYYRWLRAASLLVQAVGPDQFSVTGGNSPHVVRQVDGQWHCDCADAANGHLCKHAIAVRHLVGDSSIPRFGETFNIDTGTQSLWTAWNDVRSSSWK